MEKYSEIEMKEFLRKMTASSKVLSLIGMCKNAGKTTTLNAVLSSYLSYDAPINWGLMSIGLDGETQDRTSSGQKPEIFITEGTIFVTPAHLWSQSDVSKEILEVLQIGGSLGSLLVIRARSDGHIQLSGPSSRSSITKAVQVLETYGANKIIIDGSINRRVLSEEETSEIFLCTGHVCFENHRQALQETMFLYRLFSQLPEQRIVVSENSFLSLLLGDQEQTFYTADQIRREGCDWLSEKTLLWDGIFYRGAVHSRFLRQLEALRTNTRAMRLVVPDGSKIVASREHVERFLREGNSISVRRKIPITGIFVNHNNRTFERHDDYRLIQEISELVTCPVLDWKERLICTNPL